jgi:hypothetical protein
MPVTYKVNQDTFEVSIFIDVSDPSHLKVLSPKLESTLDKKSLPAHIVKETSTWKRPNFSLQQFILSNAYVINTDGTPRFDPTKHIIYRIRTLLQNWSLSKEDSSLTLSKIVLPDNASIQILSPEAMKALGEVDNSIVDAFYAKAMDAIYPERNAVGNP